MRGAVDGLLSPVPLAVGLPAVYQEEDPFVVHLVEAFDTELAPIVATLDNLSAYFDPRLTPVDFLGWLASWVALDLDEMWDERRRRTATLAAVDILRRRGTAVGLADELRLAVDGEIEIVESGGSAWSLDAGSPMVGTPEPALVVRVRAAEPAEVDLDRLDRIVRAAKPAHVPHQIVILDGGPSKKSKTKTEAAVAIKPDTAAATKPGTAAATKPETTAAATPEAPEAPSAKPARKAPPAPRPSKAATPDDSEEETNPPGGTGA